MIRLKAIADCSIQLEKARLDGGSEVLFGVLSHLIVERGRSIPRSTLAEYFWWNSEKRDASHCLRQVVYKLRQLGAPIETSGEHYLLGERAALADFDCADERTLALSPLPAEEAVAVFPGFAPNASAAYLTWLERTREKAGRAIRGVLVRALGDARRRNGWDEAAKLARQCLVLDPLNEEATLTLAEFTALRGDKREALRIIDGYIEEMGGTYADLRLPASLLRSRISERVAYPPASAAGKVALIGREESLRVLAGAAAQANAGIGHTCVLHGPPGIGKTRLLTEFANISAMRGARIVRVECHADAVERPLAVFMELAPQLLRMPGALGCSPEALKLVKRLGSYDPTERLDPDEYGGAAFLNAAVRSSLRDLVDAIASERPLYVLIEDVHWIDRVSLEVLKELIGSNRGRQLLVVMTTRALGDGTLLDGVDRRQLVVHDVPKLSGESARLLASALCDALAIQGDATLADWCTERSDGIPLYMTELLAHWRDTKDRSRIPVSLEALIEERVCALDKATLYAMQAIALLEGDATSSALEAVLGMQRWQVMGCVEELEKGGLVVYAGESIAARHSLLGDAAIQKLGAASASMLHRSIATHLTAEMRAGNTDPVLTWRAASHWNAAGSAATALELVSSTARYMASVGAVYEAADLLKRALALCADDTDKLRVLNERRAYLEACGLNSELQANCETANRLEVKISGNAASIHSLNEIGLLAARLDGQRIDDAMAHALACIDAADATIDHRLAAASIAMTVAYTESNTSAAHGIAGAIALLNPSTDLGQLHKLRSMLIYEYEFGDVTRSVEIADQYLDLFRRNSSPRLSQALRISSYPHRVAGHVQIATERCQEALSFAQRNQHPLDRARSLEALAHLAADDADHILASKYLSDLLAVLERYPPSADLAMRVSIATVASMVGDTSLALTQLAGIQNLSLSVHGRCDVLASRMLAAATIDQRIDDAELDELSDLNERLCCRPGQEIPTVTIAIALAQRDRAGEAIRLVRKYAMETRRESWGSRNRVLVSFLEGKPLSSAAQIRSAVTSTVS